MFFSLLKIELRKCLNRERISKTVLFETIIIAVISFWLFYGKNPSYFGSYANFHYFINHHTVALIVTLLMIFPLLGSLAVGDFYEESPEQRAPVLCRSKSSIFWMARYFLVFVLGFLNVFYILELLTVFEHICISDTTKMYITDNSSMIDFAYPELSGVLFLPFIMHHAHFFFHLYIIALSIFSGACCCLSYSINLLFKQSFVGYVGGFVIVFFASFFLMLFQGKTQVFAYFNMFSLITDVSRAGEIKNCVLLFIWIAIMLALSFILFFMQRRSGDEK